MRQIKKILMIFVVLLVAALTGTDYANPGIWTALDYPGGYNTWISGIDGNNMVGTYQDIRGLHHGFLYNGTTWTTINAPWAVHFQGIFGAGTHITRISRNNIVGYYDGSDGNYHGFLYDGTNWASLDFPGASNTFIYGIDGTTMVGEYWAASGDHGFIYNGTTWTSFDSPLYDISGDNVVGKGGFIYNIATQTSTGFTLPGFVSGILSYGIDGTNIVGIYYMDMFDDTLGFFYNGTTGTPIIGYEIYPWDISGNTIVGTYWSGETGYHGFVYKIGTPSPTACITGGNRTLEAQGPYGANVTLDGSYSRYIGLAPATNVRINDFNWYRIDPCKPDNKIPLGSGEIIDCNLPLGINTIVLEVTDTAGAADSNEITVTVQDTTPPEFKLSVTPTVLWPPNHKMVKITPSWTVKDLVDPSPVVSLVGVTTDDKSAAKDDIQLTNDGSIYLRAEKDRTYNIKYKACDASGNCTAQIATITVPHNGR